MLVLQEIVVVGSLSRYLYLVSTKLLEVQEVECWLEIFCGGGVSIDDSQLLKCYDYNLYSECLVFG